MKFKLNIENVDKKESRFDYFYDNIYLEIIKKFYEKHKKIVNLNIPLLYEKKETCIANSTGKYVFKIEYYYKMDILMSAILNGKIRFNYYSEGICSQKNKLKNIKLEHQLNILYNSLLKMNTIDNYRKKIPVVLSSGIGGVLIHEACGHSLESREILKNKSILNLCTDVENSALTIVDDPTILNLFGSSIFDDEGNKTHRIELIKDGKIKNYLIDNDGSSFLNKNGHFNGRRESYYNLMSSRMSNTYILPGKYDFEEIITSVKYGIYVKNVVGGVVDTISGNFSFIV